MNQPLSSSVLLVSYSSYQKALVGTDKESTNEYFTSCLKSVFERATVFANFKVSSFFPACGTLCHGKKKQVGNK